MGTLELRNIINGYVNTADDTLLLKVKKIFESHSEEYNDPFDSLSSTVQDLINKGLKDIEEGRLHTHNDVNVAIKKRFNIES